jgi:diguanylate cyclase (GGDEF)-like protein
MALTDPLTNLYSRRHFDSSLRQEFDRALSCNQPLSLILIDLDQFKPVNDTWGHGVGDAVLIAVAGRIRHATRSTDIVCRYGGDEFAVIAPGTAISSGKRIADRLRAAISSESYAREDRKIHIGCSVGVASLWPDALTPAELLLRADEALITAKRAGGNRICCSD